jgi:recA bacterial DNA recombination protein
MPRQAIADKTLNKVAELEKFMKSLNKNSKFRGYSDSDLVTKLGANPPKVETISTGSLTLDQALGGGFGKGRLIEIYGPESSGKTSVALTAIGNVQREGGKALFVDVEYALDPSYARKLGVDTSSLYLAQPDTAEMALDLIEEVAGSGLVDIIVLDSIAALTPKAELEGSAEDVTVGLIARLLSKQLRKLVAIASRNKSTIIFINQTRDKIGGFSPYGTPQTTPGGKAPKYYATQRIKVARVGKPDLFKEGPNKGLPRSVRVKYTVEKNKIAPPFRTAESVLEWSRGINQAAELFNVGKDYGILEGGSGGRYNLPDTDFKLPVGADKIIHEIETNKELFATLEERVRAAIEKSFNEDVTPIQEDDPSVEGEPLEDLEPEEAADTEW